MRNISKCHKLNFHFYLKISSLRINFWVIVQKQFIKKEIETKTSSYSNWTLYNTITSNHISLNSTSILSVEVGLFLLTHKEQEGKLAQSSCSNKANVFKSNACT